MLRFKIWLPTILWATLIFYLSSIPNLQVTEDSLLQNLINISAHFLEYLVLTLLILSSQSKDKFKVKTTHSAVILALIFSVSDEFHQSFVPGRTADLWDVIVDVLGIYTATQIWKNRQNKRILQKYAK